MSRIWDVDGIEWEDLPTVSDLLCAADTKILAREVALRYGGKPGGCGRGDSDRGLKRARRKLKKLRKIDPEPSDKIVLLPKHVINRRGAGRSFGYYDVSPCAFTRDGVQRLGEDALVDVYSWELPPLGEESASVMLGYRVWLGGEWDLCERYRFLAAVCASVLNCIREEKELRRYLEQGGAAPDMNEDDTVEGSAATCYIPRKCSTQSLAAIGTRAWDSTCPGKTSIGRPACESTELSMTCLPMKRSVALRRLGKSLSADMRSAVSNRTRIC